MNTLVLRPSRRSLRYSGFHAGDRRPAFRDTIEDYRGSASERVTIVESLRRIERAWLQAVGTEAPEVLAVRGAFGGEVFPAPTVVEEGVIETLESLTPFAPLHLPVLIRLVEGCREVFPGIPVALVFETSFFANLPRRESYYGLDPALMERLNLRRFGYHGIYHEAACDDAGGALRAREPVRSPRIISVCLEPRPEVAAVIGRRPVMVTSGVTPLEGLPGLRTCGELDPSIVLTLSNDLRWGPEKINETLTQESGIFGLMDGSPGDWKSIFHPKAGEETRLARESIRYRILLACGSAVAAMGGVDGIVFSGSNMEIGQVLGPWLASRLKPRIPIGSPNVYWICYRESLDRIIADRAPTAVLGKGALARIW